MKNKILFIFISLFVFIYGVNKVSATVMYEYNNITYNEEYVYNQIILEYPNFDISVYNYVICNSVNFFHNLSCIFFESDYVSSLYSESQNKAVSIKYLSNNSFQYYEYRSNYSPSVRLVTDVSYYSEIAKIMFGQNKTDKSYTNFDFLTLPNMNMEWANSYKDSIFVLDFTSFIEPEEPEPEEYQIENKIYLPIELEENMCPYILDKDTIRVYDEEPTQNSTITYTDYFINSHYITKSGSEIFENDVLTCLDKTQFTTAFYYRFDFHQIMIIFISMLAIIYVIFGKIIHSFFLGFRR